MRTIAHISDLHFGTETPALVEGLLSDLTALQPSLVVVSGDLTQRARSWQFKAAKDFLDRLPFPYLVVPGNHDIPLYDVLRRALRPLHRYRRYITADLNPSYIDDELAVLGVNTARALALKNGRISMTQIKHIVERFRSLDDKLFKVLVTHHPFIPPADKPDASTLGRAKLALEAMEKGGCELILAGHLHLPYAGDVRTHHMTMKRSVLVAQAGTALSYRLRGGQENAYNLITINPPHDMFFEVRFWNGTEFTGRQATRYKYDTGKGWIVGPTVDEKGKPKAEAVDRI